MFIPPIEKTPGVGYLEGMGIGSRSGKVTGRGCRVAWEVLTLGRRVLFRQHRNQRGTMERDCRGFWVRRL